MIREEQRAMDLLFILRIPSSTPQRHSCYKMIKKRELAASPPASLAGSDSDSTGENGSRTGAAKDNCKNCGWIERAPSIRAVSAKTFPQRARGAAAEPQYPALVHPGKPNTHPQNRRSPL